MISLTRRPQREERGQRVDPRVTLIAQKEIDRYLHCRHVSVRQKAKPRGLLRHGRPAERSEAIMKRVLGLATVAMAFGVWDGVRSAPVAGPRG